MKKLLLSLALIMMPVAAYADNLPVYVSVGSGITMTNNSNFNDGNASGSIDIKNSENFSGAVGTSFLKDTRTELEISYRSADLSSAYVNGIGGAQVGGSVDTWTYLANVYYDFLDGQPIRPYVSAGIGAATHRGTLTVGGISASANDTEFAYQAGLGASYSLTKNVSLWGGYRYLGSSDANFQGLKASYGANEINAGLRYKF
jgi:opacity protein-like surface antigen